MMRLEGDGREPWERKAVILPLDCQAGQLHDPCTQTGGQSRLVGRTNLPSVGEGMGGHGVVVVLAWLFEGLPLQEDQDDLKQTRMLGIRAV